MSDIKTRIAPSPTGNLHVGTARAALYNRLYAKKHGGQFVLRVEDTDEARSTKFYEEDIIESLKWLGLGHDIGPRKEDDHGPYFQMQRLDIYQTYINQLLETEKAYHAWENTDELTYMREQAQKAKKPFVYRKIDYTSNQLATFEKEGRKSVIRFAVEPKSVTVHDIVKGDITIDMA